MVFLFVTVLMLSLVLLGSGQEFGGSLYSKLSWAPDEGFLVTSRLGIDAEFDSFSAGAKAKIKKNKLAEVALDFRWYERPLRLSGKAEFTSDTFDQGVLELRYWEDPWIAKLKGSLSANEPPKLEFEGSYEDKLETEWYLCFRDPFHLKELKLSVTLPLDASSSLSLGTVANEDRGPELILEWEGTTGWGDLQLKFSDFRFYSAELLKEWSVTRWEHELNLTVDVSEALTVELAGKSTFYWAEDVGYGISTKLKQTETFELKQLQFFVFGPRWELRLKPVAQELYLYGEKAVGNETLIGVELSLGAEEWEGSVWVEGVIGEGPEWSVGCDLIEGLLDEIYLEVYVEI